MKKQMILLVTLFLVGFGIVKAQVSANATVTATIVTPIAISKTVDMNFGNIATNGEVGTVVLSSSGIRTGGNGITLPSINGTITPATFEVTGSPGYAYDLTIVSSTVTLRYNGVNSMTVSDFISNLPSNNGVLDVTGKNTFAVGATLNVGANQASGVYQSTNPLVVRVNYN